MARITVAETLAYFHQENIENLNPKFIEEKNWGFKYNIMTNMSSQVTHNYVVTGGYCSWHCHEHKINRFYVLSGMLKIIYSNKKDELSEYLGSNQKSRIFTIAPGIYHQFRAIKPTIFIEIDTSLNYNSNDIIRQDEGGISNDD